MDPTQPDSSEARDDARASEPNGNSETTMTATIMHRNLAEWHGRELIDSSGQRIGRLEDVYYDVETEEPQFGTVKEGLFRRHLTFVPLVGITIGPDNLQLNVTKDDVKDAPNMELNELSPVDEPLLYHHYQLNYTPLDTESGRRLARR